MSPKATSNLYGNLDLLILRTLEVEGPIHGLGVMDAIQSTSVGGIEVEAGALYRALHRLEARGFLSAEWRTSDKNRRAKFYTLTAAGESALGREKEAWTRYTRAVCRVLGMEWEVAP
ncbi:MAG: PadR family transcriptional regulator [Longimicrobiales bacterium]